MLPILDSRPRGPAVLKGAWIWIEPDRNCPGSVVQRCFYLYADTPPLFALYARVHQHPLSTLEYFQTAARETNSVLKDGA